jgi:hypothetical protein
LFYVKCMCSCLFDGGCLVGCLVAVNSWLAWLAGWLVCEHGWLIGLLMVC